MTITITALDKNTDALTRNIFMVRAIVVESQDQNPRVHVTPSCIFSSWADFGQSWTEIARFQHDCDA